MILLDTNHNTEEVMFEGIHRLIIKPLDDMFVSPEEAIKLDVYDLIYPLFEHASPEFWATFVLELWNRGLKERADFILPSAHKKIKQALNIAIRNDVLSILAILKE